MRNFFDSSGTEWTVFEVRRQAAGPRGDSGEWSYLPSGFSSGWLCFETETAKKRLTKFPDRWREFSDEELENLLHDAAPAPRPSGRLSDDLRDLPPDARSS